MITVNNKTWSKEDLEQLIMDAKDIAFCIRLDIDTIRENDEIMDDITYTEFSNKY